MFFKNRNIFNTLFEAIPEGVIIVDNTQTIIAANTSAENMFGYKKDSLSNKHLNILIPLKFHSNHSHHFSNFIKNKSTRKITHDLNLIGIKKNKIEFPIEIGLNPFTYENENFVLALIIDITIRKKKQRKN